MVISMGNQLFLTVLSLSLSGALTGLLLLLLRPFTLKYLSKTWNYYIWLLVIARLLLPVHFETNLVNDVFSGARQIVTAGQAAAVSEKQESSAQTQAAVREKQESSAQVQAAAGEKQESSAQAQAAVSEKQESPAQTQAVAREAEANTEVFPGLLSVLCIVWIFGVFLSFFLKLNDYRNFKAYIRADCKRVTEPSVLALLENTRKQLSLGEHMEIYTSPLAASPAIIGMRKPFIILPESGIDKENLSYILKHELMHLKRKDLWYKWLFQLTLCVHWFNPLLYLINKKLNIDCELSCDERVIAGMEEEDRKNYGNVLLDTAEIRTKYKNNVFSTTLIEDKRNLKERLKNIIRYKKSTPFIIFLSLAVILLAGITAAAAGVKTKGESAAAGMETDGTEAAWEEAQGAVGWPEIWDSFSAAWQDGFEQIFGGIADSGTSTFFMKSHGAIDKSGEAYLLYDRDLAIAGEDIHDGWQAYSYAGKEEEGVSCEGLFLNGSDTLLILYAKEDTQIQADISFELENGKFKLVLVGPEGEIWTINESGKKEKASLPLKKGRNAVKMVGQAAEVRQLDLSFKQLVNADFDAIYGSESEEYAYQLSEKIKSREEGEELAGIDWKKLEDSLPYLGSDEVSLLFREYLNAGVSLPKEQWTSFLVYSDSGKTSEYIAEAADRGKLQMTAEIFDAIVPYLEKGARAKILLSLDKETFTFEMLNNAFPYLEEKSRTECTLHYLELGNRISYSQFDEMAPYLSEDAIREIDEMMSQG